MKILSPHSLTNTALACCALILGACSHPIEIEGDGEVWSLSGRSCTLEDYREASPDCTRNYAIEDYHETYYATGRPGWRLNNWENYCSAASSNQCAFDVAASTVHKFWGTAVPPLRAIFVGEDSARTLSEAARNAGINVGVAIAPDMTADRIALVQREFTSVTPENAMKWSSLSPAPGVYDFTDADATVAIAESANLRFRGHTLIWHRLNGLPAWLEDEIDSAADPAQALRQLIHEHIATTVGRYAGRIAQWDVVNEPLAPVGAGFDSENIFYQTLGEEFLDIAFHAAHRADPSAQLFLNETFTEYLPAKFDALVDLASDLLARGVPLHGVGLQAHLVLLPPDGERLREQIAQLAALGLHVELTELDIPVGLFEDQSGPLRAQGIAFGRVFAACLSVPECTGITLWGLDDSNTWLDSFDLTAPNAPNRPLLFDEKLKPKPAYHVVKSLLDGH